MSADQKKRNTGVGTRESAGERFAVLAALGEQLFHADDLANLWHIRNRSTLHMTLARYVSQGLLHRVQKGLYSLKNPADLNPSLLGVKALHGPAYISCETVLFDHGVINQPPQYISIISRISRRFTLANHVYRSRKLADEFLFNDAGIDLQDGVRTASVSRAVADMLYFNRKKYFDALGAVQWNAVKDMIVSIGYSIQITKQDVDTK